MNMKIWFNHDPTVMSFKIWESWLTVPMAEWIRAISVWLPLSWKVSSCWKRRWRAASFRLDWTKSPEKRTIKRKSSKTSESRTINLSCSTNDTYLSKVSGENNLVWALISYKERAEHSTIYVRTCSRRQKKAFFQTRKFPDSLMFSQKPCECYIINVCVCVW